MLNRPMVIMDSPWQLQISEYGSSVHLISPFWFFASSPYSPNATYVPLSSAQCILEVTIANRVDHHAQIQKGRGQGARIPLENHEAIGFLRIPWKITKLPSLGSSACQ